VDLTVDIDNPGAIAFYESQGFHREGLLHGYVRRTGETEDVDMLGGRSEAPVTDGKVTLEIGPLPVYLLR